jgi:hypothetical protein
VLTDLLTYVNELVNSGQTSQNHTANYLQTLIRQESSPNIHPKNSDNPLLLISGLIIFGVSILGIGYLLGNKKTKNTPNCE